MSLKIIFKYGITLASILLLFKWIQWKLIFTSPSIELYIALSSILFLFFGIWISKQLSIFISHSKTKDIPKQEKTHQLYINYNELEKLNLTKREYEVLELLSLGYSNAKIADQLFLSISTIKTHVSNILFKLDVKSRTEAMEKVRRLKIIA